MKQKKYFRAVSLAMGVVLVMTALFSFAGCGTGGDDLKASLLASEDTQDTANESGTVGDVDDDGTINDDGVNDDGDVNNGDDGTTYDSGNDDTTYNDGDDGAINDDGEPINYDGDPIYDDAGTTYDDGEVLPWSCLPGTVCEDTAGNKWYTDEQSVTMPYVGSDQDNYQDDDNWANDDWTNDDGGDNSWGWMDDDTGDGGHGQGPENCFGVGNEECRDQALKADYRDIERMQREIKQLMKEGDASEFSSMLSELNALEDRLDSADSQEEVDATRDEVWAIQWELEQFRMQAEVKRMQKEMERQENHFEKDREFLGEMLKTVSDEWVEKIQEQLDRLDKLQEVQSQLLEAMESGEDWDVVDDLRWELDDLYWEMDDFWWEFEEIKTEQWAGQMFDDVERDVESFLENEYQHLSSEMKEKADELTKIAKSLIEEGRKAQEEGDMALLEDVQFRLEELGRKGEKILGKTKTNFDELGFTEDFDMSFENFSGDMSYEKQMEIVRKILTANPDIIQQVLLGDPVLAERTLKIFNKVPDDMQNEYLESKAALGDVYTEIEEANSKIKTYKEELFGYNYFGDSLDELVESLEEVRDGSRTLEDVISQLDELKQESREMKHSVGIVSFPDYDDSDWYYESVEGMTDFLKGKEKEGAYEFAGGDFITFAETLKITLEKFGKGEMSGTPKNATAQNHWAKGYYVRAEKMGITLLEPNHLITRGEMARLIVEATLGRAETHGTSNFSDLSTADPYFNYLETLHDYGVISGDAVSSGLPTVRSGDTINRAETAKVINTAYDNLQFETMELGELDYLLEGISVEAEVVTN